MREFCTKSAYAASALRRALSDGTYSAGERLTTARLAKELGLSMTPVREALIELANEGLVELSPHRGARVAEIGLGDLSETYLARSILEPAAARIAAAGLSNEGLADLRRIHRDFVSAVRAGHVDDLLLLNEKFHFAIYDAAASPLLNRLIRTVWASAPNDTFRLIPGRMQRSVRDHSTILRALADGDGARAEHAMRDHVKGGLRLIAAYKKRS